MSTSESPERYHHGDLRHALIEAALEALATKGLSALGGLFRPRKDKGEA